MFCVRLESETDFEGWRRGARALRLAEAPPDQVAWRVGQARGLLDGELPPPALDRAHFSISRGLVELAQDVILHRDAERFNLLYRLVWRARVEPQLMALVTDPEVARAVSMRRQVRDAEHKMHAFTRFRRVGSEASDDVEAYVAWFESPHHVIERGAEFFVARMANLRFSILTPDVCAHWDGRALSFTPGVERDRAPAEDDLESFWTTYFSSIFNPARLNARLMSRQMPGRYWRNMPEAASIPGLVRDARERAETMVTSEPTAPSVRIRRKVQAAEFPTVKPEGGPESLERVAASLQACRRCDLWRDATQGVAGEGPREAPLMFVGEQPGDVEDLKGRPFIGPAGDLFNRALIQAGVPREACYVTNAVKHFKWEPRGKRRLHKRPDASEVQACRWWLEAERRLVRPTVIVALGATAAFSVIGRHVSVTKERGLVGDLGQGATGFVTVHPSYLLRLPDEQARAIEFERFVLDLGTAYGLVAKSVV